MKKIVRVIAMVLCAAMLAVPVMAAENFTPSVTQKPGPAIKPQTDTKGEDVAGIIIDDKGKEVESVGSADLFVVPYADADKLDEKEEQLMKDTYKEIAEAKILTDVAPKLEDALKEINKDRKDEIKAEELVVRDLVDVIVTSEIQEKLNAGHKVNVKFELNLQKGETLIVMQLIDGEWVIIYGDEILIDEDGNAIVPLTAGGPVAFIVK